MITASSLTPDQNARADRLHGTSLVLISHDHMMSPSDFDDMRAGGVTAKMLHMTVDVEIFEDQETCEKSITSFEGWTRRGLAAMDNVLGQIERSNGSMRLILTAKDIEEAKANGQIGVIMGFEGGKPLEGSIKTLRCFYRLGLRFLQFTWAYDNQLSAALGNQADGLTEFGREVVREMNRLGMLIDISHLSPRAISEVFELTKRPVVLSHGAATRFAENSCNLNDDQIKALARNGGVLGVHFCSHIVNGEYLGVKKQAPIEDVIRQIDYIVELVGIDTVALGPDFFPVTENYKINTQADWLTYAQGLENIRNMRNITRSLVVRGYSDEDVRKILGGNLMRVFRGVTSGQFGAEFGSLSLSSLSSGGWHDN